MSWNLWLPMPAVRKPSVTKTHCSAQLLKHGPTYAQADESRVSGTVV